MVNRVFLVINREMMENGGNVLLDKPYLVLLIIALFLELTYTQYDLDILLTVCPSVYLSLSPFFHHLSGRRYRGKLKVWP